MAKFIKTIIITTVAFGILLGLTLAGFAYAYKGRFYPGVQVGGVSLAGKNYAEGTALMKQRIDHYISHPVVVVLPDINKPLKDDPTKYEDLKLTTTAGALGISFPSQTALEEAWQVGHQKNVRVWGKSALPALLHGFKQALAYQVDTTVVKSFIATQVIPKIGIPIPATLVVKNDTVSIAIPQPGLQVDQAVLAKIVVTGLATATDNDTTYLRAPTQVVTSPITAEAIKPLAATLDTVGNLKISIAANSVNTVIPTRAQILTWVSPVQDDKNAITLVVQKDSITSYLNGLKSNLDSDATAAAVIKALAPLLTGNAAASVPNNRLAIAGVVKPGTVKVTADPGNYTLGKFEGKYVEVNLAEQKMYLINGQNLEKTYVVSSGKWSTPTPTGTFSIHGKSPRAYSAEFGLYMPYWQDFLDGAYGLHELPEWPNGYKEGESHLGTPVSHGCVRLGIGAAKEVYDWTTIGTPVYIH